jgi:hypothetical protein
VVTRNEGLSQLFRRRKGGGESWLRLAKEVHGDRAGQLRLENIGDNGMLMRLTTVDKNPATDKNIVISRNNLSRS